MWWNFTKMCWIQFALLFYASLYQISAKHYGGANLQIHWTYHNPGSLLESGIACDRMGNPKCDVFFTLCLRNAAKDRVRRSADRCDLYQVVTKYYNNVEYLVFEGENATHLFIPNPVPNRYTFEMSVYDVDLLQRTQSIGHFISEGFWISNKGLPTPIFMRRQNSEFANMRLKLQVTMVLQCVENFYGEHCSKECVPKPSVYECNEDGDRICMTGYTGELCDREDSCLYEPCAEHAICISREDGRGRICECNGHEGPECYPGYDPCSSAPCQHDGECRRSGKYNESFLCVCTGMWTGHRCSERRLACVEELDKLKSVSSNQTDDEVNVCLNGGKCLEFTDRLAYRCDCEQGWTGVRCEKPQTGENQQIGTTMMLTLIVLIAVSLLILIIVLAVVFIWRYRAAKKRAKIMAKHSGIVYFHADSDSDGTLKSLMPGSGHFVNQTYGFPSDLRPRVAAVSPTTAGKLPAPNVYDECDPLGLLATKNVYGTTFGPDVSASETEEAPPLPKRPSYMLSSLSRQTSSSGIDPNRNSETVYSPNGSTVNLISNPIERKQPTIYRRISPATNFPSTFSPNSSSIA